MKEYNPFIHGVNYNKNVETFQCLRVKDTRHLRHLRKTDEVYTYVDT